MEENSKVISLNIQDIMAILPHRPPFLLVDRVIATDCDTYVDAIKNVTMNEPFFVGHFPGQPVMPGVLIMDSLAQAAAIVVLSNPRFKGLIPYFLTMDKVKFRKPVQPGDQLLYPLRHVPSSSSIACSAGNSRRLRSSVPVIRAMAIP